MDASYKGPFQYHVLKTTAVIEGGVAIIEQEIPERYKRLVGFRVDADRPDLVLKRGLIQAHVGNIELIEAGVPVVFFLFPVGHQPGFGRVGPMTVNQSDRRIRVVYTDKVTQYAQFAPHNLRVTLLFLP